MRNLPSAVTDLIAAGTAPLVHLVLRFGAFDRASGEAEVLDLWTGADDITAVVDGETRLLRGAGRLLDADPFTSTVDMQARAWTVRISPMAPEATDILRIYDARDGECSAWEWFFDPATGVPLAAPVPAFRGAIVELDIPTPPEGVGAVATVRAVSDQRRLTKPLTLRRSDAVLRARTGGADGFRKSNSLAGITTPWGES